MVKNIFLIGGLAAVFALMFVISARAEISLASLGGEKITYNIKKLGIKAGEATLEFVGPVETAGQKFVLIIFRAMGMNFLDEEKIFADPETLLPQRIERNLNIFGKRERIVEYYTQNPPQVRVVKTVKGKISELVLRNTQALDNIYCFIFRYRQNGTFQAGKNLNLNLPTQRVQIVMKGWQRIAAAGKNYEAYTLESQPAKYKVWFDASPRRIPLRIDGAVNLGPTSMIMREYEEAK